jgi:hypothetical protein
MPPLLAAYAVANGISEDRHHRADIDDLTPPARRIFGYAAREHRNARVRLVSITDASLVLRG